MNKLIIHLCLLVKLATIYAQACIGITPKNRYDCFKDSTSNTRCCFKVVGTTLSCAVEDSTQPDLDCGALGNNYNSYEFTPYKPSHTVGDLDFVPCGRAKADKKESCTDYSHLMNSCCRFTNAGKSGCFYLGKRYNGDYSEQLMILDSKEYKFECSSSTFSFTFLSLFLSIALFL